MLLSELAQKELIQVEEGIRYGFWRIRTYCLIVRVGRLLDLRFVTDPENYRSFKKRRRLNNISLGVKLC